MDFITFSRKEWQQFKLESGKIEALSSNVPNEEITSIFQPLAEFIHLTLSIKKQNSRTLKQFLHQSGKPSPFIIGIAGSVAAGKSTTAKLLAGLLSSYEEHPKTAILSTDHFLYPNKVLEERGIMHRKGFPESYDYANLHHSLKKLKSGAECVEVPVYSHATYDILPEPETIERPDILFVEGINVLQVNTGNTPITDYLDITLYVDATVEDLFQWYWERIQSLVAKAINDPQSYFNQFKDMDRDALFAMASEVWETINLKNLNEYILPTRERADIIMKKGPHHIIQSISIKNRLL